MKKPLLAMFVVGAIAIGLLIVLAVGIFTVDEDGREQNGLGQDVIRTGCYGDHFV